MRLPDPLPCLQFFGSQAVYGQVTRWGLFLMRGVHSFSDLLDELTTHAFAVSKQPDSFCHGAGVQVMMKAIESSTETASAGRPFTGRTVAYFDATICLRRYLMNALLSCMHKHLSKREKRPYRSVLVTLSLVRPLQHLSCPAVDFP